MKISYLIFCLLLFSSFISAQTPLSGMYRSKNGHLVVSGKQDTVNIIAQSDQLLMVLICENAEMTARININALQTGIDRFDTLLSASKGVAFFVGKMEKDIINTQNIPPFQFDIAGSLTLNSISRPMIIKASLDRIPDDESAGMFSGNIAISLKDFNMRVPMPYFSDLVTIRFSQVLLRRVCE